MLSRTLTIVAWVFTVIVALMSILGLYLYRVSQQEHQEESFQFVTCTDLTHGCHIGQFNLRFDRKPQVMQPFNVSLMPSVSSDNPLGEMKLKEPETIYASFGMVGMEMGLNRYRLAHTKDKAWVGDITLPVCVQGKSEWDMQIEITSEKGVERFRVKFAAS